jgi:hypothetical protein
VSEDSAASVHLLRRHQGCLKCHYTSTKQCDHMAEDSDLIFHHCENIKSNLVSKFWVSQWLEFNDCVK